LHRSDAETVKDVISGNIDAFAVLVERYQASLIAVCLSILLNHDLANETAHEAFIKAFENLSSLKKPEKFSHWLIKIAKNQALSNLRKKNKNTEFNNQSSLEIHHKKDKNIQHEDGNAELLKAVMKLPSSQKQVIMLRYFEDMSIKQISEISKKSTGTVTKQLSRAHKRLKIILKDLENV
jgi:RNA polymerase sigma-70 factor (ECF subfamily)